MPIPLGVVDIVYASRPVEERSELAVTDGFRHIDVLVDVDAAALALPVGCPTAFPKPRPGWCSTPAPRAGPGMWERTVAWVRAAPGALLEPWAGAVVNSSDACRAMIGEVPGLRLLVDTGHVADWGGDPVEWNARIEALRNVGLEVLDIVKRKDSNELWDAAENLDVACEGCHRSYWYPGETAEYYSKLDRRLDEMHAKD